MAKKFRRTRTASSLVGEEVVDATGTKVGTIVDVMLDVLNGRVSYAVLSFGGLVDGRLFAIPWSRLSVDADEQRFVINVTKEALESAPGFDESHWPDLDDLEYANGVYAHYGATPYWI